MKSYAELNKEIENLKLIIIEAISNGYHTDICSYNKDQSKLCDCWVADAYAVIYPPEPLELDAKAISRGDGEACKHCGHSINLHTVRVGTVLECSKVNCVCQGYEGSGKQVESHWA